MPKRIATHKPKHVQLRARIKRVADVRDSASARGYSKRWARYSRWRLKEFPWCIRCESVGIAMLARCTDHVIPAEPNEVLFWEARNHQSLCNTCHSQKTAAEDGGFGNVKRLRSSATVLSSSG